MNDLFVRDREGDGKVHRVGDNIHDCLFVDDRGVVQYHNLQNGDGTMVGFSPDRGGYEFVKTDEYGYCEEASNIKASSKDEEYMRVCRYLHSLMMKLAEDGKHEESNLLLLAEVTIKEILSKYNTINDAFKQCIEDIWTKNQITEDEDDEE